MAVGNAIAGLVKLVLSSLRRMAHGARNAANRESLASAGMRASDGFEVAAHR
jgi:hypothetical protein